MLQACTVQECIGVQGRFLVSANGRGWAGLKTESAGGVLGVFGLALCSCPAIFELQDLCRDVSLEAVHDEVCCSNVWQRS
jgi:hypothetical protein